MDPGSGEDDDRPAVPRLLHRGGHVAFFAAALRLVVAAARPARLAKVNRALVELVFLGLHR